jgi:hypothetical protein
MNDHDPLSDLLKTWSHQAREAPDFNRDVWARVRRKKESAAPATLLGRLLTFPVATARWAMPLAASVLLLLSLAVGSGAAFAYESITRDERMAAQYARSIDPLQMSTPHTNP